MTLPWPAVGAAAGDTAPTAVAPVATSGEPASGSAAIAPTPAAPTVAAASRSPGAPAPRATPCSRTNARVRSRRSAGGVVADQVTQQRLGTTEAFELAGAPVAPGDVSGHGRSRDGIAGHQPVDAAALQCGQLELFEHVVVIHLPSVILS